MNDWASRRKSIYLTGLVLFFTAISFLLFYKFWYKQPTCFDATKNGDETGIDCGGSCVLICKAEVVPPIVRWDPRMFEVIPGTWSVVVYVDNPNIGADAVINYSFTIYDNNNRVISERKGLTLLPKNKTVGVFEGSIFLDKDRPARAIFEIDKVVWRKNEETEDKITIKHSPLLRSETSPRVEAEVVNSFVQDVENIELIAAIFDGNENAIAASRTFIERIKKNETAKIFFTWPAPFKLGTKACEKPSDIVVALDRSGSMISLSKNPPEPLSSVKNAASYFVSNLRQSDRAGLITFATEASIDTQLVNDFSSLAAKIDSLSVLDSGTQYTNIADALSKSFDTLLFQGDDLNNQKIIVLLTDGIATRPVDPSGSKSEAEEIAYAEKTAESIANSVKQAGGIVYTIGLGKDINQTFLERIASSKQNYFNAPATTTLKEVYDKISSSICKEVPARIEITYRILN